MGKRFWSLALSVALIGAVFSALPAKAQGVSPTDPPAVVNIDDPFGDANTQTGDNTSLPEDASTVGDIGKVWFTNTAETISLHMQVEGQPPASASNVRYNVYANPVEGKTGTASCLRFEIIPVNPANPGTYAGESLAKVADRCPEPQPGSFYKPENGVIGELLIGTLSDETGVMTATFPRSSLPAFGDGMTISQPFAIDYIGGGTDQVSVPGTPATVEGPFGFTGLRLDDSKVGTDYVISSGVAGGAGSPVTPTEPPGKSDPPGKGKKNGCPKGKGKKKGACPKPKPANTCPAYVPGEQGAAAPTSIVTAAATEDKPVEVTIAAPAGDPTSVPASYQNIQVDAAAAEAGLYVRYEFPTEEDHDIYLNYADGSEAAHAGGFNPAPFIPANPVFSTDGTGTGGHSEQGAEALDGIRSADCAGYTLQMDSFLSAGGDMTLKLWLGEIQNDPAAPGGGAAATAAADSQALTAFYDLTGLANPSVRLAQASSTPAADKGCKKGKGKKNGCKKPPVACAPYTPGELGAEQPTVTVTDSHTAEAPLLQPITLDAAVDEGVLEAVGAGETPRAVFNVQVDSALQSAGLYVTFEFDTHRDYDLYGYFPDGKVAASSHGFQPAMETNDLPDDADQSNTDSNHGGQSTATSENLVGIITPDCGGYTLEFSSYLAEGGDFEVKLWLGEGVTAPGAPE